MRKRAQEHEGIVDVVVAAVANVVIVVVAANVVVIELNSFKQFLCS